MFVDIEQHRQTLHLVAAGDPGPGVAGLLLGAVQVGVAVLQVT